MKSEIYLLRMYDHYVFGLFYILFTETSHYFYTYLHSACEYRHMYVFMQQE